MGLLDSYKSSLTYEKVWKLVQNDQNTYRIQYLDLSRRSWRLSKKGLRLDRFWGVKWPKIMYFALKWLKYAILRHFEEFLQVLGLLDWNESILTYKNVGNLFRMIKILVEYDFLTYLDLLGGYLRKYWIWIVFWGGKIT